MVCGRVSQHRTELVVIAVNLSAVRYREDILPHVVTFLQAHPVMTLQHDNATSHTARSVHDFQERQQCQCSAMASEGPGSQAH